MKSSPIVVCGTGLVGLATALGLARAGYRPCLLGPRQLPAPALPDSYHPRVYAVSPPAQQFLQTLGAWDLLDARRVTAVEGMQVHGDAGGNVELRAWQRMLPALAWIVESGELERSLHQALRVYGVDWVEDRFERLTPGGLATATGRELPAALVIGADGAQSAVRRAAGIEFTEQDYQQLGLVAHLTATVPHDGIARQWFVDGEVVALLPMPDTDQGPQVSLVWSMEHSRAQAVLAMAPEARAAHVQTLLAGVTGGCLGVLTVRAEVLGFPLTLAQSDMIAPGVALVGDAAHRVHPLAGQGLNLGLGDVEQLVRVLVEKPGLASPGDDTVLRRYRRARAEPVWAMRMATDGLHRLFATDLPPLVLGRNLGMSLVNRLPWLKQRLIAAASNN